ncbi:hypothetical protein CISIN_1g0331682mg, partial [Citrus sinensis]
IMIGFHFYRCLLPSPLVDDSRVESWFWFDDMGERLLLLTGIKGDHNCSLQFGIFERSVVVETKANRRTNGMLTHVLHSCNELR